MSCIYALLFLMSLLLSFSFYDSFALCWRSLIFRNNHQQCSKKEIQYTTCKIHIHSLQQSTSNGTMAQSNFTDSTLFFTTRLFWFRTTQSKNCPRPLHLYCNCRKMHVLPKRPNELNALYRMDLVYAARPRANEWNTNQTKIVWDVLETMIFNKSYKL